MSELICRIRVNDSLIKDIKCDGDHVKAVYMNANVEIDTLAKISATFVTKSNSAVVPMPQKGENPRHLYFHIGKGHFVTFYSSFGTTTFFVYQEEEHESQSLGEVLLKSLGLIQDSPDSDEEALSVTYTGVGRMKFEEGVVKSMESASYSPDESVLQSITFDADDKHVEDIYDTMEDAFEKLDVIRNGKKISFIPKINQDGIPLGVVTGKRLQTGTVKLTYCEYTEE